VIAAKQSVHALDADRGRDQVTPQTKAWRRVVIGLFFASGISALMYELAWTRLLHLLFGDTVLAVSTVLSSFMAGLALGGFLGGRLIDRRPQVLTIYAGLEMSIGLIALLLLLVLQTSTPVYVWLYRQFYPSVYLFSLLRFLIAFALLLIPTTLMGATLPVLSRYVVHAHTTLGQHMGLLYGLNTGGAVIGCLLAGYVLIGSVGLYETVAIGAGLNLAIGLLAWGLRRRAGERSPISEAQAAASDGRQSDAPVYNTALVRLVLWGFALSGFAALSYEVIWTRALVFFVGNSTYAFSAMLTTFLCGLALGSLTMAKVSDQTWNLVLVLGLLQLCTGIYGLLTIPILGQLFYGLDTWWSGFTSADWGTPVWLKFAKTFAVIFPPTFCMGGAFPLVSKIVARSPQAIGRTIGNIYALNTLGAIAGSWMAGFVLIPILGMQKSLVATALVNVGVGSLLLARGAGERRRWGLIVYGGILALFVAVNIVTPTLRFADIAGEPEKQILYYDEGIAGVVKVATDVHDRRLLSINGWSVAGTGSPNPDVALVNDYPEVQKMLAHLPMLLHPGPRRALVIGFGAGGTSWAMSRHNLEQLDIVEFIPGVIEAARFFPEVNHDVLADPRVRVTIDDGRNYLLITQKTYDVVSVDTLDPKHAGNGNLYTREFYELSKRVLKPGGIFVQWLPYHQVDNTSLKLIVRTFQQVYPHATLWLTRFKGYTLLVGTLEPLSIDVAGLEARFRDPTIQRDLAEAHVATPWQFLEGFTMAPDTLRRYSAGVERLNSYNHPYVEFFGFAWHDPIEGNLAELARFADDISPLLFFNDEYPPERQAAVQQQLAVQRRISRHIFRGYLANWRGQLQEGTREYRKALKLDPRDEGIKHALGISAQQRQQAVAALQQNSRDVRALGKLGYIAWNEQRYAEAIQYFQQVLALDPGNAAAYIHLGVNYVAQGSYEASIAAYHEAERLKPEFAHLVAQSIDLVQLIQRAAEYSDDPTVHFQLGLVYAADGRSDRAIAVFERVVGLAPHLWQGFFNLARAYEAEEHYAEALEAYSQVLVRDPDNAQARNNYEKITIKTALDLKQPMILRLGPDSVLEVTPDSANSYYHLGLRYLRNEEPEAAIDALQQAVRLQPESASAYFFLGVAYATLGVNAEAEGAYGRAIALAPDNAQAYNYLGLLYQRQGRYRMAIQAYQRAIALAPDYAMPYANLAASYESIDKHEQALTAYRNAWQRDASLEFVREKIDVLSRQVGR
jgi:spermidine synthase